MTKPRYAYAANRRIGLKGLELLLEVDWEPSLLMFPKGQRADYAEQMRALIPHVPVLEGKTFREVEGIRRLKALGLDYIVMIHFPYVVPREVLDIPRIGVLNLHPAYLPFNRGWHTPTWTIWEETPYGATLHWVDEGVDTGDIVLQRQIEVSPGDTAHKLYQRVMTLEIEILKEAVPLLLEHNPPRIPQGPGGSSHAKEDIQSIQNLDLSAEMKVGDILRLLCALTTNDWSEAAFFEEKGARYRVRVAILKDDE
jgi:methionyl-tRNA formyltransferase